MSNDSPQPYDDSPQPYTGYTPRDYRGYNLEKKGRAYGKRYEKPYSVRICTKSELPEEKYVTPNYETTTQAFTHAYGWVDSIIHKQNNSNETEDPWKKSYDKVRKYQAEFYRSPLIFEDQEVKQPHEEKNEGWEKKLEEAYKEGWDKKKKLVDTDNEKLEQDNPILADQADI
jgi:hypothetical protein